MTIDLILFDAGDVLYEKPNRAAILNSFLLKCGCTAPHAEDTVTRKLKLEAHAGRIDERTYYRLLLIHYGVKGSKSIAEGIRLLYAAQRDVRFFEGVPETLHALKTEGVRLGIVTNTFNSKAEKLEWFRAVGIDRLWDSYANSCDLQLVKPKPEIYLAAIKPIGGDPKNTAFVGHAQKELDGAKALGMTTIRFNADADCINADHSIFRFSELLPLFEHFRALHTIQSTK